MSTTTLRLPDELKARVGVAADAAGLTPHAFMLRAIEAQTLDAETQSAFEKVAAARLEEFHRDGVYYAMEDVRSYMVAKARGAQVAKPRARKLPAAQLKRLRSGAR